MSRVIPERPAPVYTIAETVEIEPCPCDLAPASMLAAMKQGGILHPGIAPYRLVVHPTASRLAVYFAYLVFGMEWSRWCEIALEPTFDQDEWALDCAERRVHSEGA